MPTGFVLSREDADIVRELVAYHRRRDYDIPSTRDVYEEQDGAPEVYVAKVPSSGIKAVSTWTDGSLRIFSAECPIYVVKETGLVRTMEGMGFEETVHSLSQDPIPGNTWVLIIRTKPGEWFVTGTMATGTGTGTGTGGVSIGGCQNGLAGLMTKDCLLATCTGTESEVFLQYNPGAHNWLSTEDITFLAGSDPKPLAFSFSGGTVHLKLDDKELLSCGEGRFQGGGLTGHYLSTAGPSCSGPTFEIAVDCEPCPGTGSGTAGGLVYSRCCGELVPTTARMSYSPVGGAAFCGAMDSGSIICEYQTGSGYERYHVVLNVLGIAMNGYLYCAGGEGFSGYTGSVTCAEGTVPYEKGVYANQNLIGAVCSPFYTEIVLSGSVRLIFTEP